MSPPNISSTPIPSDNAIFSDEIIASSPPSSPPEFSRENTNSSKYDTPSKPSQSIVNAFSILGKRKAFTSTNDNTRLTKKYTPSSTKKHDKPLTQMQISLGQEVQKRCKACGMEYIASSDEDRKLHDKYHAQNLEGYDVGKDFLSKSRPDMVFNTERKGDEIAAVDALDNPWRRKRARAALDVVQRELGAVEIPDKQLWDKQTGASRHTMYMYVRQSKCIGLLLVERITSGNEVLEPAGKPKPRPAKDTAKMSALERLRARRASQEQEQENDTLIPDQPIRVATTSSPAKLGVSRIWTSPSHRRQGIAKALLDLAVQCFNERVAVHGDHIGGTDGSVAKEVKLLRKDEVAFSQPTEAGARLARRWIGRRYGWLIYVD
jgi:N-acetyltransferase